MDCSPRARSYEDAVIAQTGRRTTKLDMRPFTVDTDDGRREWRQLLLAIEKRIVLADKHPGMLADDLSDYLFARSTGHIGSLMTLINRGCQRAVRTGAELPRPRADGSGQERRGLGEGPPGTGDGLRGATADHQDRQGRMSSRAHPADPRRADRRVKRWTPGSKRSPTAPTPPSTTC